MRVSKAALLEAINQLDTEAVDGILARDPSLVAISDRNGRNLLHIVCGVPTFRSRKTDSINDAYRRIAAKHGFNAGPAAQVRLANALLDRGLPLDMPHGRDTCTALFEAVARARNLRLVRVLLGRGADVRRAPGGCLFAATWWQDLETLDSLLDAGAEIDVVVGVTPFLASWCSKRFDAAKHLAQRGANVNYQDKKGRTALYHGVDKEFDPALLSWLVRHGASPDIHAVDGDSPRLKASRKRDTRFAAALIR